MAANCTIAVDAMGGDRGAGVVFQAITDVLETDPALRIIVFQKETVSGPSISPVVSDSSFKSMIASGRLEIRHSSSVVDKSDKPTYAYKHRADSSMADALRCVAEREAQACVTPGNTGALLVFAKALVGTHTSIERPAFIKRLQLGSNISYVLDLGANVDCRGERLFQFAVMGSALVSALHDIERPQIALLNIGSEDIKGNEQVRLAARLIEEAKWLNYRGFVEGGALFNSDANVIVCDGFVGNAALKAGEEVARQILKQFDVMLSGHWWSFFVRRLSRPLFARIRRGIDPDHNNGASLVGLLGTVVKSHGNADRRGFAAALRQAASEARSEVALRVCRELDSIAFNA
ncbi:phosphate acyltransferase PlsX [Allohahella marinimesophila]|uniref:Phosphate acyltransferase n=1 Tax=Allohahella marinimesophila TaxID=1054972 RepID=A0ABP7NQR2_9GAMM